MKYNKWLGGIGLFTVCLALTGCNSHSHEWQEATCTTPKTCATCGETEGEALGHTWVEASCSAPKTCSICGETEGEALEHTLTEANYQQAPTCEVCGETVGEPLQADFEKYNFTYVTETDKEYPFITKCYTSDDLTNGKVIFSDYQTFTSDEEHEAKDGYEWKTVTVTFIFDDEIASSNGVAGYFYIPGDFYDSNKFFDRANETDGEFFSVNYNGIDYTECEYEVEPLKNGNEVWVKKDDGTSYFKDERKYFFCFPVGYDGSTLSIMSYETNNKFGGEVGSIDDVKVYMEDDNTVTFRLK